MKKRISKSSKRKVKTSKSKRVMKKTRKKKAKKAIKKNNKKIKKNVGKARRPMKKIKKVVKKPVKKVKKVVKKDIKKLRKIPKKHVKKEGFFEELTSLFTHKRDRKDKKEKLEKKLEKLEGKGKIKLNKKNKIEKDLHVKKEVKKPIKAAKIISKIKKDIIKKQLAKKSSKTKKLENGPSILTGIKGFDSLFEGKNRGIPQGASILIEGGPGSGKTLFCLATVYNLCKQGKKCLYMSFEEPEERLIHHMKNFNWDAKDFIKKGKLRITRFDAIDVSRSIEALLSAAKKELLIDIDPVFFPQDFTPDFVVIDSLTSIASAFSGEESRFRIYMEQLFRYLEKNKMTNFLIREVSSPSHIGTTFKEQGEAVSFLSDGIIVLYNVIYDNGERSSAIEILKMRGVNFKKKIVELKIIDGRGLEVNPHKILSKTRQKDFKLT